MHAATDHRASDELVFFAFDLLHLDGENLAAAPLLERKARLAVLLAGAPAGCASPSTSASLARRCAPRPATSALRALSRSGSISPYAPGNRGIWVKAKCLNRREFVVVGWTEGEGSRKELGSLLLGYYVGRKLIYAGRVGTGITQREMRRRLEPLAISKMPQSIGPKQLL
jgi:bifunctional non-homologous end joining protein LigD